MEETADPISAMLARIRSEQAVQRAETSGTAMAKRKKLLFLSRWEVSAHKITDNPYHRKRDKAEHVAWHNAFYFARKEMNRGVW